jgi:fatty-acyl-CoA synthase/long-chain acyl-CoA synthetase
MRTIGFARGDVYITTGPLYHSGPSNFARIHMGLGNTVIVQRQFDAEQRGEYHTVGDLATFDQEGYYYICDRRKDMIISSGVNIYPAEIESALEAHPGVSEAAVIGVPDDEWGESVRAFVIRRDARLTGEALAGHARGQLAAFKVPRSFVFVETLPRTGSGKVLKRELRTWSGEMDHPSASPLPVASVRGPGGLPWPPMPERRSEAQS